MTHLIAVGKGKRADISLMRVRLWGPSATVEVRGKRKFVNYWFETLSLTTLWLELISVYGPLSRPKTEMMLGSWRVYSGQFLLWFASFLRMMGSDSKPWQAPLLHNKLFEFSVLWRPLLGHSFCRFLLPSPTTPSSQSPTPRDADGSITRRIHCAFDYDFAIGNA